jgi:hypothetical protein
LIRRPSPGLVVASLALLIALGGTSVAAVSIVIPAGSVGTAQLKANAVTSAKVKDGTLVAGDFKGGALPAGAAGPAGPAGPAGAAGAAGPPGPSDGYSKSLLGPIAVPLASTTLTSLSIPQAGSYVAVAKAAFTASGAPGTVICGLAAESDVDLSGTVVTSSGALMLSDNIVHKFAGPGSIDFKCLASVGGVVATAIRIVAVRVGEVSSS